ncbi:hypothetical protein [Singulisphaera sp. GP187]|uniref:hypothetical protein n=1 Tax=Singulisphaera sp. GP187 TaxID=1882752 RepID=UPI00135639A2|nr:hypothetical protein [Singulisphaera sp. GP187]
MPNDVRAEGEAGAFDSGPLDGKGSRRCPGENHDGGAIKRPIAGEVATDRLLNAGEI